MSNNFDKEMQSLMETYAQNLPNKIQEIAQSLSQLRQCWDTTNFIDFSSRIHKLHGSAGIYGYNEISQLAGKLESYLNCFSYDIPPGQKEMDDIANIFSEIQKLPLTQNQGSVSSAPPVQHTITNKVYLYDDNFQWSTELSNQVTLYGYEVKVFNTIENLFNQIKLNNPFVLIINYDLIKNPFIFDKKDQNIYDLMNLSFKEIHTIFFSTKGDFLSRLDAVRMGCNTYLTKPFSLDDLIVELDSYKEFVNDTIRILIVDDEKESAEYFFTLLNHSNIKAMYITSAHEIDNVMHQFNPHLILIDLYMPECNGMELARVIRQQKKYESVPIIYLSAEKDKQKQMVAMSAGADDFILKSTNPAHVVQHVTNKARRFKKINSLTFCNSLTGAFNLHYTIVQLEKLIKKQKILSIAITKFDNIDKIVGSYGYASIDQIMVNLYMLLESKLDPSCIIGHYTHEQFIIVFPGYLPRDVESKMMDMINIFKFTLQYHGCNAFSTTFNASIKAYTPGESIRNFIQSAVNTMPLAKTGAIVS